MKEFADGIMRKCHYNKMRALQYLEYCIRCCEHNNDNIGLDKFVAVRDFIECNIED